MQEASINVGPAEALSNGTEEPSMCILKIGSCSSLSGRSTLAYHIGCSPNAEAADGQQEIHFRIHANTAKGFFSNDWIPLSAIHQVIDNLPLGTGLTSFSLNPLFFGKSINTSGFLLAALKEEGLVVAMMGKRRYYERMSSDGFMTETTVWRNLFGTSLLSTFC
jgi:hypothetical protein